MDAWLIKKSNLSNDQSTMDVGVDNEQFGACSTQNDQRNERAGTEQNANEQSMP